MANVNGGIVAAKSNQPAVNAVTKPLEVMLGSAEIQARFDKLLGKKAAGFISSILAVVNNNPLLQKAHPKSILAAAAMAASLDLPINPSLGKAYIVPYAGEASFQLGYKGVIELAQRTGKMKSIVMTPVCEGEIKDWNKFTETYTAGKKISDNIVGYFARFETVNGFAKATYWTKEEVIAHAKRFSKMCTKGLAGVWKTDFDAMACKTVLLSIMKTYAPMSIEMEHAVTNDGGVFNDVGEIEQSTINATVIEADAVSEVVTEQAPEQTEEDAKVQQELLDAMNAK